LPNKLISRQQFIEVTEKIHYIEVKNDTWQQHHRDLIRIWIERHCTKSWVYYDGGDFYAFGSEGDFMMFTLWIKGNPLTNADGMLEGIINDEGSNP
jgi:hypothetical protein